MPFKLASGPKMRPSATSGSSAPAKHLKKSTQEAPASGATSTVFQAMPQMSLSKSIPSGRGPRVHIESDDEDPESLLASFQQHHPGDNPRAELARLKFREPSATTAKRVRPARSQSQIQHTSDTGSSPVPSFKIKTSFVPESGSRCDNCIIQRRGCDGKKPICGRCIKLRKDCVWREEPISRSKLEKLRHKKAGDGLMEQPKKRRRDKSSTEYTSMSTRPAKARKLSENEEIKATMNGHARPDQGDKCLKRTRREGGRPGRQRFDLALKMNNHPTTTEAPERGVDPWTYEDHLNLLSAISEVEIDPFTKEQVFGQTQGNEIFDNTTKVFEDFKELEDLEKDAVPPNRYEGLLLNWEDSEVPTAALANAALSSAPWLASNLRRRIGLPEYPAPTIEIPQVTNRGARAILQLQSYHGDHMQLANAARDELSWLDDGMSKPSIWNNDWDNEGRLPRPDETASFSWDAAEGL